MECHCDRVPAAEVNDVAIHEKPFVDLLIVYVRTVRRIPVDQENLAFDLHHLGMQPRNLGIFQYDLTNRRFPPDPDPRSPDSAALAGALAVEDREAAEEPVRWGGRGVAGRRRDDRL